MICLFFGLIVFLHRNNYCVFAMRQVGTDLLLIQPMAKKGPSKEILKRFFTTAVIKEKYNCGAANYKMN